MGMTEYFKFAGVDSRQFGIHAFEKSSYGADAMQYDTQSIPGLDGDLQVPQNRYPNRDISFGCLIYQDAYTNYRKFRDFLLSQTGYNRLESGEHPGEFYLACFKGGLQPVVDRESKAIKFDLTFNCKPQRFLKSGERVVQYTANGSIKNPTHNPSKPLLRVYGAGSCVVGGVTITITAADVYTDIDCELMECFKGSTSKNDKVQFSTNDFPVLPTGSSAVTLNTGISKIEITPRWFLR